MKKRATRLLPGLLILFPLLLLSPDLEAANPELFDTPNALGREKGEVNVTITAYDAGGINLKAGFGIARFLELGVVGYVHGLIGAGSNSFEIPGIYGRIHLTDAPPEGFNFALGYAPLFHGSFTEGTNRPYGPYVAASKGFFLVSSVPHLFSLGLAWPLVPDIGKPMGFASLAIHFGPVVEYGVELTDISFQPASRYDFVNNHSLRFSLGENFQVQFVFQWAGKSSTDPATGAVKLDSATSRNLRIVWQNQF
jgi:hypothetical protein